MYKLYEEKDYGKRKIILKNKDKRILEDKIEELANKKLWKPIVITVIIVFLLSIIIGGIVGVDSEEAQYNIDKEGNKTLITNNERGIFLGMIIGMGISMFIIVVGGLAGGMDFNNKYYIEYEGK